MLSKEGLLHGYFKEKVTCWPLGYLLIWASCGQAACYLVTTREWCYTRNLRVDTHEEKATSHLGIPK